MNTWKIRTRTGVEYHIETDKVVIDSENRLLLLLDEAGTIEAGFPLDALESWVQSNS